MRKNRIISFLLSILLCCTMLTALPLEGGAAAADAGSTEEIAALKALGIIKNYGPDGYVPSYAITRGEVAVMILNMMGMDSGVKIGEEQTEQWAAPAMQKAAELGIMTDSSTAPILYQDLMTALVRASGYEMMAQANGGYPQGYLAMGARAGIGRGVSADTTGLVSKATAAKVFYQAATADMLTQTGFGLESRYDIIEGRTILSEYRKIYEVEGKLTGTETCTLSSEQGTGRGMLEIDDEPYRVGSVKADCLLGYAVQGFYQESGSEKTVVYLAPQKRSEVTTIPAEDLSGFADNVYTYSTETGTQRRVKVSSKADILYNGKPVLDLRQDIFLPKEGKVELVATTGAEVDLVVITAYQTWVVQYYSDETQTLYDKYSQQKLVLDTMDDTAFIDIADIAGKQIAPDNLTANDVVTLQASLDGKYVKGTVARKKISGMVTSVTRQDDDRMDVTIDGQNYTVCPSYLAYGKIELKPGGNVMAYLDFKGDIAGVDDQPSVLSVGYLTMAAIDGGVDKELQLRIFTSTGDFVQLSCAPTIKIDGKNIKEAADALDRLTEHNNGLAAQLMQYRTNTDGKVAEIDTAYCDEAEGETHSSLRLSTPSASLQYKNSTKIFGNKVVTDNNTVFLNVPRDNSGSLEQDVRYDDELYEIKNFSYFNNDSSYTIESYTTKDTYGAVQVVMLYNQSSGTSLDKTSAVSVVESVSKVLDAETGETLNQITCYGGESGSFAVDSAVDVSGLHSGDIIRFATGQGRIKMFQKLYDYELGERTNVADPSGVATSLGYVYYKESPYIRILNEQPVQGTLVNAGDLEVYKADAFGIYIYDGSLREPTVRNGSMADILDFEHAGGDCSKVFISTRNNDPRSLIIIK